MNIPKLPLADWIDKGIFYVTIHYAFITQAISNVLTNVVNGIVAGLLFIPPAVIIAILAAITWRTVNKRTAFFAALGLLLIWNLELWQATIETITLVLIATLFCIVIGVPLGILAASHSMLKKIMMPILDFMQTMPAFVYLIPAIPFFGLGPVSAIFATLMFAMPPTIRLTIVGIEQVPAELVEAANAFGSTPKQTLYKVQIPLAMPMIMAGINQTVMLALSMVVIAAMIGAGGLGGEVWKAIQRLQAGNGFVAGLAVVIIAMILDRITQSFTKQREY